MRNAAVRRGFPKGERAGLRGQTVMPAARAASFAYGKAMPSLAIRDIAYDEARNELTVTFTTGRVYAYALVPASVAAAFRETSRKGAFFNTEIRDRYPFAKARREPVEERASLADALRASREAD